MTKNVDEKYTYHTKDLAEAAAILAKGRRLLRLQPQEDYFLFVFEDEKQCEEIANSFWSGELRVNAKGYADALRTLKDRIFARR